MADEGDDGADAGIVDEAVKPADVADTGIVDDIVKHVDHVDHVVPADIEDAGIVNDEGVPEVAVDMTGWLRNRRRRHVKKMQKIQSIN